MKRFWIITLFPEYFAGLESSILKRAVLDGATRIEIVDLREFGIGPRRTTDDRPYGGGPGMVLMVEPLTAAIEWCQDQSTQDISVIVTAAKGRQFTQQDAQQLSEDPTDCVLVCGHYEGVDQRVIKLFDAVEYRIGPYVLTGGEPAAAVMVDSVVRLLPDVLGNEASLQDESHSSRGKLAHPVYTRPEEFRGLRVPSVLQSGHHALIKRWQEAKKKLEIESD